MKLIPPLLPCWPPSCHVFSVEEVHASSPNSLSQRVGHLTCPQHPPTVVGEYPCSQGS